MEEAEAAKAKADKEKKEKEEQEAAAAAAAGTAEHAASGDNDAASSTLEEEPEHVPQEETVSRAGFIKPVVSYWLTAGAAFRLLVVCRSLQFHGISFQLHCKLLRYDVLIMRKMFAGLTTNASIVDPLRPSRRVQTKPVANLTRPRVQRQGWLRQRRV